MQQSITSKQLLLSVAVVFAVTPSVSAQYQTHGQYIETGRYTMAKAEPTRAQENVLSALSEITFSNHVQTVGEAIETVLDGSGFRVAKTEVDGTLFKQPLPEVHRQLGLMSTWSMLQTLAGEAWEISADGLTRVVTFDLSPKYKARKAELLLSRATTKTHQTVASEAIEFFVTYDPGRSWVPNADGYAELKRITSAIDENTAEVEVIGVSQSIADASNAELANRRAEKTAERLRNKLPVSQRQLIEIGKAVIGNNAPQNKSGAMVVVKQSTNEPVAAAVANVAPIASCELVTIQKASLKTNVERLLAECGYRIGQWNFGNSEYIEDWLIQQSYSVVVSGGIHGVLDTLRDNYLIEGRIRPHDQTIDFFPGTRYEK